jgi:peptide-methionine (R)-S-oxide reductase
MAYPRIYWAVIALLSISLVVAAWLVVPLLQRTPQTSAMPREAWLKPIVASKTEDKAVEPELTPEQMAEAKKKLTAEQYNVCFLRGTEPPGSGKYEHTFDPGTYHCAVCGTELFKSDTKYDSHSGWPAFWDAADKSKLVFITDNDLGYPRTEVRCKKCGAHLGHVFEDGPKPTGQRYCINSVALEFVPDKK